MTSSTHTVLLGFDFGLKRIGVAVGQTVTQTARPLITVSAVQGEPQWNKLDNLVKTWQPDGFVLGIPLNMDGTAQPLSDAARRFGQQLHERFNLPVYEMDERLSTKDARERIFAEGGYKALQQEQIDSVAAQLILQNWLTSKNNDK